MKKMLLWVIASTLAVSLASLSAEVKSAKGDNPAEPAPKKIAPSPEEQADGMIKKGDTDGDGKLSRDELIALFQKTPTKKVGGDGTKTGTGDAKKGKG